MQNYDQNTAIDLIRAETEARRLRAEWLRSAFEGFGKRRAR